MCWLPLAPISSADAIGEVIKAWATEGHSVAVLGLGTMRLASPSLLRLARRRKTEGQISQNLNQNLTEHEVVTWTVVQPQGDTVKVERVTHRERVQVSGSKFQDSRVAVRTEVVRDTVYIERTDSVLVQDSRFQVQGGSKSLLPKPSSLNLTLKWICFILLGLIALIITAKVCLRR